MEERRRHLHRRDTLGARALTDTESAALVQRLTLEDVGQRETVEMVGHRRAGALDAGAREGIVEQDQALGFGVWQRTQQHRADNREDGRVRADAQGQRQDGRQRERAVLTKQPEGKAEILNESVNRTLPSTCAGMVLLGE